VKKVILVTGSGSGIGRAISLTFAHAGYVAVINDIIPSKGENVLREIESNGGDGLFIHCDISNVSHVERMFETIRKEYGRIDVLVNNAGTPGPFSMIVDTSDENWNKTMAIHLNGTFYCMREAAKMMIENGSGRISKRARVNCHRFRLSTFSHLKKSVSIAARIYRWKRRLLRCRPKCPAGSYSLRRDPNMQMHVGQIVIL
jgi:NAD(P)-dependent dehydrogenase (short-subunit alcohol dehydrogenase family)